jgi:GT2 family glycosyltransferase
MECFINKTFFFCGMLSNHLVSVIIPTMNRKADLDKAIESIGKQDYKDVEIIVIDNGSEDNTFEFIKKKYKHVRLIQNSKNLGACKAKNQGIEVAKGEFLLFFDDDSEFYNGDTLTQMVEVLKDLKVGSVGGEKSVEGKFKKKMITVNGETRTLVSDGYRGLEECSYNATCNMLVKKDLMFELGGFDEVYFYLAEDKDIGYKINKKGLKNVVHEKTTALHKISFKTRVSNFNLFHRNRIRFVILNFNFWRVVFLPFLDLGSFFDLKKYKDLKQGSLDSTKKYSSTSNSFLGRLFKVGKSFVGGLIYGYYWNFLNLNRTFSQRLKMRRKGENVSWLDKH